MSDSQYYNQEIRSGIFDLFIEEQFEPIIRPLFVQKLNRARTTVFDELKRMMEAEIIK